MAGDRDRFRVELDVNAGAPRSSPASEPIRPGGSAGGPFRIALIGDFSGRANRGILESGKEIAGRRPIRVDRDDLDDAIARLAPSLQLTFGASEERTTIAFSSLDDFHPDGLYQRLPRFRALRDAESRARASASMFRPASSGGSSVATQTPTGVLDAILGDAPQPPGGAALAQSSPRPTLDNRADGGLSEFVQRALAPHLVPSPDPSEAEIRTQVNAAIGTEMRAVLHHPDFQRLEAAWRSAAELVRRLDVDANLQLHLVDVSLEELAADLDGQVEKSGIYRLLVDGSVGTPGMPAWALLIGLFSLGRDDRDFELLARLGSVARDAGAPFVGGASLRLAGVPSIAELADTDEWSDTIPDGWSAVIASGIGRHVALVLPRMLLRLPYGDRTHACELFPFEEVDAGTRPQHDSYLWGTGSLATAILLGEAFADGGWSLRLGNEISGLPFHVYRIDGQSEATPCAEVVLSERIAERLLQEGLTPLLSVRDTDSVILPALRSIAHPPARLIGRWTTASDVDGN